MIYFDNAATSFPKPESVYRAVDNTLRNIGASPGRSGHTMTLEAERIVFNVRELIAGLFNISDSSRVIFTNNATSALNLGIKGVLSDGDHVITSTTEHNSVTRPLKSLERKGVEISKVKCPDEGKIDPKDVASQIKGNTKLIVITHASNVIGTVLPLNEIGNIARKNNIIFMVDASQTAGCFPIDVQSMNIDLLVCSGHKSLLGPQGTGVLYVREGIDLKTLCEGGTGSDSEKDTQPRFLPDRYESGTLNTPGIAGLGAAIEYIQDTGIKKIREHEKKLTKLIIEELSKIDGTIIYGTTDIEKRAPIVSFNIEGFDAANIATILSEDFDIMTRVGLHCSPDAHKTIGTFPSGTLRFSFNYFNTEDEIHAGVRAIKEIINSKC